MTSVATRTAGRAYSSKLWNRPRMGADQRRQSDQERRPQQGGDPNHSMKVQKGVRRTPAAT
jgi:hypothetical protein